jgi:hypothetical protein
MNALIIGDEERTALTTLRVQANKHPVDMLVLTEALKHRAGKAAHKLQMTAQSVALPTNYLVTFSIETRHPGGTARHMSMSVGTTGRVPNEHAVWMVAECLGFTGTLDTCVAWAEDLEGHGAAVNVLQFVMHDGAQA